MNELLKELLGFKNGVRVLVCTDAVLSTNKGNTHIHLQPFSDRTCRGSQHLEAEAGRVSIQGYFGLPGRILSQRERARGTEQSLGDSSISSKVLAQEDLGSMCRTQIKMSVECPVFAIPGLERDRLEAPWDSMPSQSGLIGELQDTEGRCFMEVATGGYSQLPLT